MPSLYEDQLAPKAPTAAAGTPGYEQNIVGRSQALLRPQYEKALKEARQNLANRGLYRSGVAQEVEGGIGTEYRGRLADIASGAATHSADLGEAERIRQQGRGWQVEDIMRALQQRRQEMEQEREIADANRWASLIGSATGAVGEVAGKGLSRLLD